MALCSMSVALGAAFTADTADDGMHGIQFCKSAGEPSVQAHSAADLLLGSLHLPFDSIPSHNAQRQASASFRHAVRLGVLRLEWLFAGEPR